MQLHIMHMSLEKNQSSDLQTRSYEHSLGVPRHKKKKKLIRI